MRLFAIAVLVLLCHATIPSAAEDAAEESSVQEPDFIPPPCGAEVFCETFQDEDSVWTRWKKSKDAKFSDGERLRGVIATCNPLNETLPRACGVLFYL